MTSEEIKELNAARENLVKRRRDMARQISGAPLPSIEMAEELTKILIAIEALDRTSQRGWASLYEPGRGRAAAGRRLTFTARSCR